MLTSPPWQVHLLAKRLLHNAKTVFCIGTCTTDVISYFLLSSIYQRKQFKCKISLLLYIFFIVPLSLYNICQTFFLEEREKYYIRWLVAPMDPYRPPEAPHAQCLGIFMPQGLLKKTSIIKKLTDRSCVKITSRRRHADILRDCALSHNIDQVSYLL